MCHCLRAAVATRDLTDSFPRQSSRSASGVSIINPRHCLRNAGESREIRESSAALLKQWHEDGATKVISSCLRTALVFCQVSVFGWHVLRFCEGRGERRSASGHALPVGQDVPPYAVHRLGFWAVLSDWYWQSSSLRYASVFYESNLGTARRLERNDIVS